MPFVTPMPPFYVTLWPQNRILEGTMNEWIWRIKPLFLPFSLNSIPGVRPHLPLFFLANYARINPNARKEYSHTFAMEILVMGLDLKARKDISLSQTFWSTI